MVSRTRRTSMMSTPIETIMDDSETENAGFYWRERDGVRALICAPLEQDGFTNAFSTRGGGVSPMPQDALNLAGFNEDDAENIYENRRRFLKLFTGTWTLAGCWQIHGTDVRVVTNETEAKPKSGVGRRCLLRRAGQQHTARIAGSKNCRLCSDSAWRSKDRRLRRGARRLARNFFVDCSGRDQTNET